jgi:sugar phosphate isomerase/epimerase
MATQPFGYCLNTSTIWCGDLTLEQKIDAAAKAGYDGIEPWIKELDSHCAAGGSLKDIAKRTRDGGLEVVNLIGFFEWAAPDAALRKKGLKEARRCFGIARTLNCRHVAAPPWGIHTTPGLDLLAIAERYAALIDLGKQYGVVPLVEYWGVAKTLGRMGEALLVAAECGRGEARILADVFHTYKGSGTLTGFEHLGPQTLGLVHCNDYPARPPRAKVTDADRVYPGDGIAPLQTMLRALAQSGYRGMLSLELFNESYWMHDALTVARTGLAKMKAAVRAACK